MTQTTCNNMVGLIEQQLHDQFKIEEYDGQCLIFTPMLFPDNSRVSVALEATDSQHFLLTDNGEAAGYAFVHGVPDHIARERIRGTVRRFHLSDTGGDELTLQVNASGIATGIFTLVSAIQDVANLVSWQMSTLAELVWNTPARQGQLEGQE